MTNLDNRIANADQLLTQVPLLNHCMEPPSIGHIGISHFGHIWISHCVPCERVFSFYKLKIILLAP